MNRNAPNNYLFRYVSDSPDNMPSVRLYEGDINVLMNLMHNMNGRWDEFGEVLAAIATTT